MKRLEIISNYHGPKQVLALSLVISHGLWEGSWLCLNNKNDEVVVSDQGVIIPDTPDNFIKKLPDKYAIALHVHGNGFIHRYVESDNETPFSYANKNGNDLVKTEQRTDRGKWVTLTRMDKVEAILRTFMLHEREVVNVQFGWGFVEDLLAVLSSEHDSVQLPMASLHVAHGKLVQLQPIKGKRQADYSSYQLGEDLLLNGDQLLPFVIGALTWLRWRSEKVVFHSVSESRRRLVRKHVNRKLKLFVFPMLLVLVTVTWIAYGLLERKNNRAEEGLQVGKLELARLDSLKTEYKSIADHYALISNNSSYRPSYFLDVWAATVPDDIFVTDLQLHPLLSDKKQLRKGDYRFGIGHLKVSGRCQSGAAVAQWISRLKKEAWINKIELLPYTSNKTGDGEFKISILLQ